MNEQTIQDNKRRGAEMKAKLENLGGKYWEAGERRRVYFDAAACAKLVGLDCSYYNTGNISSAPLAGESISNSAARRMIDSWKSAGLYVDMAEMKFHCKSGVAIDREHVMMVIREIKAGVKSMSAPSEADAHQAGTTKG